MKYDPAIKKNKVMPTATIWLDLEGIVVIEISQRKTKISLDFIYMWNLKIKKKTPTTTKKLIDAENILMVARWEG